MADEWPTHSSGRLIGLVVLSLPKSEPIAGSSSQFQTPACASVAVFVFCSGSCGRSAVAAVDVSSDFHGLGSDACQNCVERPTKSMLG